MTTTTPIQESAVEHLRNALQLAELWINTNWGRVSRNQMEPVLEGIAQRIHQALEQLSEPSPSMIVALRSIVESHSSLITQHERPEEMDRYWRDSAAIVLRAAVTGFTPGLGAQPTASELAQAWTASWNQRLQELVNETSNMPPDADPRAWQDMASRFATLAKEPRPGLGASVAVSSSGPSAERTGVQVAPSSGMVVERCPVCGGIVHEAHPKHDAWVHDECWGEYIATRAEFYGDEP